MRSLLKTPMLGEWCIVKTNELRKNRRNTHTHPALMFIIEFLHTATPTGWAVELFIYPCVIWHGETVRRVNSFDIYWWIRCPILHSFEGSCSYFGSLLEMFYMLECSVHAFSVHPASACLFGPSPRRAMCDTRWPAASPPRLSVPIQGLQMPASCWQKLLTLSKWYHQNFLLRFRGKQYGLT